MRCSGVHGFRIQELPFHLRCALLYILDHQSQTAISDSAAATRPNDDQWGPRGPNSLGNAEPAHFIDSRSIPDARVETCTTQVSEATRRSCTFPLETANHSGVAKAGIARFANAKRHISGRCDVRSSPVRALPRTEGGPCPYCSWEHVEQDCNSRERGRRMHQRHQALARVG